jgi:hypothetical protein
VQQFRQQSRGTAEVPRGFHARRTATSIAG